VEDTVNFMAVQIFRIVEERDLIKLIFPATLLFVARPQKKSGEARKQAGKKEGVWEFRPPRDFQKFLKSVQIFSNRHLNFYNSSKYQKIVTTPVTAASPVREAGSNGARNTKDAVGGKNALQVDPVRKSNGVDRRLEYRYNVDVGYNYIS